MRSAYGSSGHDCPEAGVVQASQCMFLGLSDQLLGSEQ
jgi:hypothetical protein